MSKENEVISAGDEVYKKFMRLPVFLILGVGFLAMYLGVLPTGMIGGMCLLLPLALIIERIGQHTPILKGYLGGAPLLLIFVGAGLVYITVPEFTLFGHTFEAFKLIPESGLEMCKNFMKSSGTNFLDFYICGLIVGAIFGINPKLLLKAGVRYAVPLLACILACCGMAAAVGALMGYGWKEGISMVAFPILGGGMGGGVVPMNQVISEATGQDMISKFVPALALGNVFAIIAAGLLDRLGQKFPQLSGDGQILKDSTIVNIEPKVELSIWNIAIGLAVSTGFFALGMILRFLLTKLGHLINPDFNINIHHLALMIIVVAACKITGIIPEYIIVACYSWFRFIIKAFTGIILLAIGIVYTNLGDVIDAITLEYVVLCAVVVFASILGAGFAGRLVGFNFIESAITAGLCMANMGGTGDVAVLSASRRMELMPFARFSTSIGGGGIIILCSLLVNYFYGG